MAIKDPKIIIAAVPDNKMDQIVDILTGSFTIGAGVTDAFNQVTAAQANWTHLLTTEDTFLFKGLWSIDGGASWQEFENDVVNGDYANGLRTMSVSGNISAHSANPADHAALFFFASNSTNYSYTVQYKCLLMARPDQDGVVTSPNAAALNYNSKNNYMKSYLEGSAVLSTAGVTPIAHNLGYRPNINVWIQTHYNFGGLDDFYEMDPATQTVIIDTANLILPSRSASAQIVERRAYYRIYLDA